MLVDTNVVIYLLEGTAFFGKAMEKLFGLIEAGEMKGYLSVITITELLVKPIRDKNLELRGKIDLFLDYFPNLEVLDVTREIAARAAEVRAATNLRVPDAILIATAAVHGCAMVGNDLACAKKDLGIPYIYLGGYL
ncbi:MAG: PIN domain-containing protein [Bacillota bacterium]|nr:PIN domain-containing protein [Bacillota bacterium]